MGCLHSKEAASVVTDARGAAEKVAQEAHEQANVAAVSAQQSASAQANAAAERANDAAKQAQDGASVQANAAVQSASAQAHGAAGHAQSAASQAQDAAQQQVQQVAAGNVVLHPLPEPAEGTAFIMFTTKACMFSYRVLVAARFKGVQVDRRDIATLDESQSAWYQVANPGKTVPFVITRDGSTLTESADVLAWLERTHPEPTLRPADIPAGELEEFCEFVGNEFTTAFSRTMMASGMQSEWVPKLQAALRTLDDRLATSAGPFAFGAPFTLCDAMLIPTLARLHILAWVRALTVPPTLTHVHRYAAMAREHMQPLYEAAGVTEAQLRRMIKNNVPYLPPFSSNLLQHVAMRTWLQRLTDMLNRPEVLSDNAVLQETQEVWRKFITLLHLHGHFEDDVVYPLMNADTPHLTDKASADHHEMEAPDSELNRMAATLAAVHATSAGSSEREESVTRLRESFAGVRTYLLDHFVWEETNLVPTARKLFTPPSDSAPCPTFEKIYYLDRELWAAELLTFVMEPLNAPQREQYVHNIRRVIKPIDADSWANTVTAVRSAFSEAEIEVLLDRAPQLLS